MTDEPSALDQANDVAARKQVDIGTTAFAEIVTGYYLRLLTEGMTRDDALFLTSQLQELIWNKTQGDRS